jgi:hypothetical protein
MEVSNKNQQPTTTLFVVNFDVRKTREGDIERYFDRWVGGWVWRTGARPGVVVFRLLKPPSKQCAWMCL